MDNENETATLLNIDERDELSVEDELVIAEILGIYRSGKKINVNFKRANQQQLKNIIVEENNVMDKIPTSTVTETNDLVYVVSVYEAKKCCIIPNAKESKTFWSEIWSKGQKHNNNAEWRRNLRADLRNQ